MISEEELDIVHEVLSDGIKDIFAKGANILCDVLNQEIVRQNMSDTDMEEMITIAFFLKIIGGDYGGEKSE